MKGKICLVTGANSGIGKVTALELARAGATVVMVARNKAKGEEALAEVRRASGSNTVELMLADLSSQKSIRSLAEQFKAKYDRLDVLVNNAGAILSNRELSVDGYEMTFALNHLGYFLLTNLLLDRLKAGAPSRVVNVSSAAHRMGHIHFDDLQLERGYSAWKAYGQSKLANVLFTVELARRLEGTGVTANSLHPGFVRSNFNTGTAVNRLVMKLVSPFAISVEKGAETSVYLATSPEVEGVTGKYFAKKQVARTSAEANDPAVARRLWEVSEKLTGLR